MDRKTKVLKALDDLTIKQAVYTLTAALREVVHTSDSREVAEVAAAMLRDQIRELEEVK